MTDIVVRLRDLGSPFSRREAADEIERLRAENERLRKLMDRPRDDGTAIAVGGEPGASAGKSE